MAEAHGGEPALSAAHGGEREHRMLLARLSPMPRVPIFPQLRIQAGEDGSAGEGSRIHGGGGSRRRNAIHHGEVGRECLVAR